MSPWLLVASSAVQVEKKGTLGIWPVLGGSSRHLNASLFLSLSFFIRNRKELMEELLKRHLPSCSSIAGLVTKSLKTEFGD